MNKIKDPVSALTHFFGAILAIPITFFLIFNSKDNSNLHILSLIIFGVSLFLLYSSSTIYHTLDLTKDANKLLRKIDHMMIFVLIAGTYTPLCLVILKGTLGYYIFGFIWVIAIMGILLKIFWIDAPRHLSTAIYIFMGWFIIFAIYPVSQVISKDGIKLMLLGGISYTIGGVIYALKWPKINSKYFGFHEIFHIFVLLGSSFHVIFMFKYI